jgi:hypothetical protein
MKPGSGCSSSGMKPSHHKNRNRLSVDVESSWLTQNSNIVQNSDAIIVRWVAAARLMISHCRSSERRTRPILFPTVSMRGRAVRLFHIMPVRIRDDCHGKPPPIEAHAQPAAALFHPAGSKGKPGPEGVIRNEVDSVGMAVFQQITAGLLGAMILPALYALAAGIFKFRQLAPTFGVDAHTSSGQLFTISLSASVLLLAAMIGFALGFARMRQRQNRGGAVGERSR